MMQQASTPHPTAHLNALVPLAASTQHALMSEGYQRHVTKLIEAAIAREPELTRAEIARRAGIADNVLRNLEKGRSGSLHQRTIERLAPILGVSAIQLTLAAAADHEGANSPLNENDAAMFQLLLQRLGNIEEQQRDLVYQMARSNRLQEEILELLRERPDGGAPSAAGVARPRRATGIDRG